MATVAQLAARSYQEVSYLLVIEGWFVMFTDNEELVGTGGDSWIGSDDWTVALGLEADGVVRLGLDLESGMLTSGGRNFTIIDYDDHLIEFMEDEPGTAVLERLAPTDDPVLAPVRIRVNSPTRRLASG